MVIIQLKWWSHWLRPKVITLSGFYCTYLHFFLVLEDGGWEMGNGNAHIHSFIPFFSLQHSHKISCHISQIKICKFVLTNLSHFKLSNVWMDRDIGGNWSGVRISWDQNSLFHEVKIRLDHGIKIEQKYFAILIRRSTLWSWDQNCLIVLFRILISWLLLWLTNRSWDWNSK